MRKCPELDNYQSPSNAAYQSIFAWRVERLVEIEADAELEAALRVHYRTHPWDFINDWGVTFDPRNLERDLLAMIPMRLWPKQTEYLKWIYGSWRQQRRGLVEKSRDCGVTWLSAGFAGTMWLFWPEFTCRFGSRKEDLVDRRGDMDSIFEKLWYFLSNVPPVFKPEGFSERCRAHMRIINPANGAAVTGEAGDDIGRGGRTSLAFIDEAAFIDHQQQVDNALSQTTNCQIDISTPNGTGNSFYNKRQKFNNTDRLFIFDWRDDPRKDEAWYERQREELDDVTVAQEIDRDYEASQEDAFIPAKWIKAAIDAHLRLGFEPEGIRITGFDPADVGDAKGIVNRHGSVFTEAEQKKTGDITHALHWAYEHADKHRADALVYDGDGMGAPVIKVSLEGKAVGRYKVLAFHGSGGVKNPGRGVKRGKPPRQGDKPNIDKYLNFRAQAWSWLRDRFEKTFEAIQQAEAGHIVRADPDDLVSIDSQCKDLHVLVAELSRPKRIYSRNGKIQVEAKSDMKRRGVDSPNLADAAVMAMSEDKPQIQNEKAIVTTSPLRNDGTSWMAA